MAQADRSLEIAVTAAVSDLDVASVPAPPAAVGPGRFEIVRCVGSGGMGIVHEAIDRERGGRVALKRLHDAQPESLARFKTEFHCLAARRHPNWVRAFELIEDEGNWFITMELVNGVDFLTWVRPFGVLDERRLRNALGQLVRAVAALHASGMVHRDIKSSNVLVTRSGRLVLLDFGLVAGVGSGSPGEIVGTPAYIAPEQAAAEPPHPAADWYSVGVLLYHALTGTLPFEGTASQMMRQKLVEDPVRPRDRVAGVADDLEQLCVALLSRDPAARPIGRELLALEPRVPFAAEARAA